MSVRSALIDTLYPILLRLALLQDAERSHATCIHLLRHHAWLRSVLTRPRVQDPITLAGLALPNRVGLAAGLDKNAVALDAFAALGFGFVEVGTVTPQPQAGNAPPRLFRLAKAQALINRMGFNNAGLAAMQAELLRSAWRAGGGIVGVNIGKNASTPIEQADEDYCLGLRGAHALADYIAINISSPNTQNLRDLQESDALHALLTRLRRLSHQLDAQATRRVPIFVKVAPDLRPEHIQAIALALRATGMDGVIVGNTTVRRDGIGRTPHAQEAGGLSGAPLTEYSNATLRALRAALGHDFPIIGVGGIMSSQHALAKIAAGANAIQLYTGLIYRGPRLVQECAQALQEHPPAALS